MEMPETLSRPSMLAGMVVAFRDQLAFRDHHTIHYDGRQTQIPIALVAQPPPHSPRLRALALFGRRLALGAKGLVTTGVQKPAHKRPSAAQTRAP